MPRLELRNLGFGPRIKAGRPYADRLHVSRRVVGAHADLYRMPHHRAKHLAQPVRGVRLFTVRHQLDDVLAKQDRGARRGRLKMDMLTDEAWVKIERLLDGVPRKPISERTG